MLCHSRVARCTPSAAPNRWPTLWCCWRNGRSFWWSWWCRRLLCWPVDRTIYTLGWSCFKPETLTSWLPHCVRSTRWATLVTSHLACWISSSSFVVSWVTRKQRLSSMFNICETFRLKFFLWPLVLFNMDSIDTFGTRKVVVREPHALYVVGGHRQWVAVKHHFAGHERVNHVVAKIYA